MDIVANQKRVLAEHEAEMAKHGDIEWMISHMEYIRFAAMLRERLAKSEER